MGSLFLASPSGLRQNLATVNDKGLARDELCSVRGEEGHGMTDISRLAQMAHRNGRLVHRDPLFTHHLKHTLGDDIAKFHSVDRDIVLSKLESFPSSIIGSHFLVRSRPTLYLHTGSRERSYSVLLSSVP